MAISWGPWDYSGGNGMRVGIDTSVSPVYSNSSSVTVTFKEYTQNRYNYSNDTQKLTYGGSAGSGSHTFVNNTSSGGVVLRDTQTWTHTYNSGGDSPGSKSHSATLSGAYDDVTPSHSVTVSIPARPVTQPAAPTGLTASRVSDSSAQLAWTRHPSNSAPYASQEVRRRHRRGVSWSSWATRATFSGSATSYTDTTTAGWQYQYGVRALNAAGPSAFVFATPIATTPHPPVSVHAAPGAGGNVVTWAPGDTFTEGVVVERREDSGAWVAAATLAATATAWTHPAPSPAFTHTYRVANTVANPVLQSTWAVSNVVVLATPPNAPANLGPGGAFDATEAHTFTWVHNPIDGSTQQAFQVEHRAEGAGSWSTAAKVLSSTQGWTMPAGTYSNGDKVEWRVRTWGVHDDPGPYSATAVVVTSARPTVAINDPGSTWGTSALPVLWGYNQADGSPQASWEAQLLDDAGQPVEFLAGPGDQDNALFATTLGNGTDWTVKVRARSSVGTWSLWDQVAFTVAYSPPPSPFVTPAWDVANGAMVVSIENPDTGPGEVDAVRNLVQRRIGGSGSPWVTIATDVPVGGQLPVAYAESFEADTGGWAWQGAFGTYDPVLAVTQDATVFDYGAASLKVEWADPTAPGRGQWVGVNIVGLTVGETYTMLARTLLTGAGQSVSLDRIFYDRGAAITGSGRQTAAFTFVADAASHFLGFVNLDPVAGDVLNVDRVMVYVGTTTDYNGESSDPTVITDPIPHLTEENAYRAVTVSESPSTATSAPVAAPPRPGAMDGMVYVNGGPGFGVMAGLWANVQLSDTVGAEKVLHQFDGRRFPMEFAGDSESNTGTVAAVTLYESDHPHSDIDAARAVTLARTPVWLRSVLGHYWLVSMGAVDANYSGVTGAFSFPFTQIDHEN